MLRGVYPKKKLSNAKLTLFYQNKFLLNIQWHFHMLAVIITRVLNTFLIQQQEVS